MLQAVDGVKKSKVSPSDLMISKIPVIPPLFRPYAITGDTFMAGHSNELYRDLLESKKGYEGLKDTFGDEGAREAEYNLYNATRALYGYGDAVNPKTKARGVSGFMSQILGGGSPKYSIPQRRLFSKTTDAVSRSVITIDPELDIDQIGIPRHIAMKQYSPHVQRKLVQMGYSNMDAIKHIKDGSKTANKVLEDLTKTMPVVYSRSPAWHKYNVIGGWATLTDGDSISTNPYVMAGLSGDFDGDTVTIHLPTTKESQEEAKDILMPSKMVLSTKKENTIVPTIKHEQILGLYTAKNKPSQNIHTFNNRAEALAAVKSGQVRLSDEIKILNEK